MTTDIDEVVAAAIELARAARWQRALALLDATDGDSARLALVAAGVALEQDWWVGTGHAADRLAAAEKAGAQGWELDFLRMRNDYLALIHPVGGDFQPGPEGKDPATIADVERRCEELRQSAPDENSEGWAAMYLGLITDNLRADRDAAPPHYEAAFARSGNDDLLAREALRHLGDHDHDNGDHASARDRWQRATALGAGAGMVTGVLSQQLLLAVLARDAGDEAGAVALAAEIARWAGAIGATRVRANATRFLGGVDPTAAPPGVTPRQR